MDIGNGRRRHAQFPLLLKAVRAVDVCLVRQSAKRQRVDVLTADEIHRWHSETGRITSWRSDPRSASESLALKWKTLGTYKIGIDKSLSLGCDSEILHESKHVAANGFIVLVDGNPVLGFAAHFGFADAGQDGAEDFLSQNSQCRNDSRRVCGNAVSTRVGKFADQLFGTKFLEVVSGPASIVVQRKDGRGGSDSVGQLPSREPVRRTSEG